MERAMLKSQTIRIRHILLRSWDPVGVVDEPAAQDEYDSYVPAILGLVLAHATVSAIADLLISIEANQMGLNADPRRAASVAAALLSEEHTQK